MDKLVWILSVTAIILPIILIILLISKFSKKGVGGNTNGWSWPKSVDLRLIFAILGAALVLGIFFLTESTLGFLGLVLWSKIFWGLLIAFLVFWSIWTGNWKWLGVLAVAVTIWMTIWIFGVNNFDFGTKTKVEITVLAYDGANNLYTIVDVVKLKKSETTRYTFPKWFKSYSVKILTLDRKVKIYNQTWAKLVTLTGGDIGPIEKTPNLQSSAVLDLVDVTEKK